jgi:uncharacterized membrane protein YwaF
MVVHSLLTPGQKEGATLTKQIFFATLYTRGIYVCWNVTLVPELHSGYSVYQSFHYFLYHVFFLFSCVHVAL